MKTKLPLVLLALVMLTGMGCNTRFKDARKVTIDGSGKVYTIPKIGRERTIKITATTEGGAVNVMAYLAENEETVRSYVDTGQEHEMFLVREVNSEDVSLEVKVPKGKELSVAFVPSKFNEITVDFSMTD